MDDDVWQRLQDIVDVAAELDGHLQGLNQEEFTRDRGAQRIAERLLEIAGEAASNVDDDVLQEIPADWASLKAMRVVLAHAYHRIKPDRLWTSATVSLPRLAAAVQAYLQ